MRFSGILSSALTFALVACSGATTASTSAPAPTLPPPPSPDPRVGLRAGAQDAAQAIWNLKLLSATPVPADFKDKINSDIAFTGNYAIQGSFSGWQIWDISTPSKPTLVRGFVCPASQSDVSVYKNLLFVSGEDLAARLDCGTQGVREPVSTERFRGLRIFDISDIRNPRHITSVQTCRGSHTHTVLVDPKDTENVYIYISGSSPVRPEAELAGCLDLPESDPRTANFRIEVIKVPVANPAQAAIVSTARIFGNLRPPRSHGEPKADSIAASQQAAVARTQGLYTAFLSGMELVLPPRFTNMLLDSLVKARGGTGAPTGADSAKLRQEIQGIITKGFEAPQSTSGPTQCHDITVFPAIGLAGGACEGYGFLLDISNPTNPVRIGEAADSNFSYWHSATFNNDGSKILFTDEWGGGGSPKCRATDPKEWGANAIFTVQNRRMQFQSYYKLPAPQTALENCVAHNGSLIPIPGRDVMVQAWYQGGISIFDWTDPKKPYELAFFDRGPVDATRPSMAGSWSVYWYNGAIYSSEIARGLDVVELTPSPYVSQNEIDAAKQVKLEYFNAQNQVKFTWTPSFAVAKSYLDQLERNGGLPAARISATRDGITNAERATGQARRDALNTLAGQVDNDARNARDAAKARLLAETLRGIAGLPLP